MVWHAALSFFVTRYVAAEYGKSDACAPHYFAVLLRMGVPAVRRFDLGVHVPFEDLE